MSEPQVRRRLRAAVLAVGTEVTDGQIIDRNSAWISARLVEFGFDVIEHRVVADDRAAISRALRDLTRLTDLLFVTGGLGPTSDDFTREILSEVFLLPLEFHEPSWQRIVDRFKERGAVATDIQRQQCYFPLGADILINTAGTANAFAFHVAKTTEADWQELKVFALPGPPIEIEAVWAHHLHERLKNLIPLEDREELHLFRTLGAGESVIAELVEPVIQSSGLRVGYRAHMPYVEVKLWCRQAEFAKLKEIFARVETALKPYLVNRDYDDLADTLLRAVIRGESVRIVDDVSMGYVQTRLNEHLRDLVHGRPASERAGYVRGSLIVETQITSAEPAIARAPKTTPVGKIFSESFSESTVIHIYPDESSQLWRLELKTPRAVAVQLEVVPTSLYNMHLDRGRKYAIEKMFQMTAQFFI